MRRETCDVEAVEEVDMIAVKNKSDSCPHLVVCLLKAENVTQWMERRFPRHTLNPYQAVTSVDPTSVSL